MPRRAPSATVIRDTGTVHLVVIAADPSGPERDAIEQLRDSLGSAADTGVLAPPPPRVLLGRGITADDVGATLARAARGAHEEDLLVVVLDGAGHPDPEPLWQAAADVLAGADRVASVLVVASHGSTGPGPDGLARRLAPAQPPATLLVAEAGVPLAATVAAAVAGAIATETGVVTVADLVGYVTATVASCRCAGDLDVMAGTVVSHPPLAVVGTVATPGPVRARGIRVRDADDLPPRHELAGLVGMVDDTLTHTIDAIAQRIAENRRSAADAVGAALQSLVLLSGAHLAALVSVGRRSLGVVAETHPGGVSGLLAAPEGERIAHLLGTDLVFRRDQPGVFSSSPSPDRSDRVWMLVPVQSRHRPSLRTDHSGDAVVLGPLPAASRFASLPGACVVRGLLADVAALRLLRRDVLEARILDEVKMLHRLVTAELFERRIRLFCRDVDRLTLAFQPIVALDGRGVVGWEALARHDGRAPASLFDAAELWGNRFCTELDVRMLHKAADAFTLHRRRRGEWPQELSVNCWPSSLADDDFVAELQELHTSGTMPASRLCLEISERSDIGRATGWTPDEFRSRLRAIRHQTGVSFAIDDFGVQHANIARLQDLDLSHVKIDKQLLYHEYARSTIEYVVGVADRHLGGDLTVVVEGWEDDCPLGLPELRALGVGAVQGFGIRRPQDGFPPLSPTELAALADRLGPRRAGAPTTLRP